MEVGLWRNKQYQQLKNHKTKSSTQWKGVAGGKTRHTFFFCKIFYLQYLLYVLMKTCKDRRELHIVRTGNGTGITTGDTT